jgi:uncharacterized membrane protein
VKVTLQVAAAAALVALIFLTLAWEAWLAPLRPGGSWLVLKALPLLLPLRGVLAGRAPTYRWSIILVLAYFTEGVVRAYADPAPAAWLALGQAALALVFFASGVGFLRAAASDGKSTGSA